MARPIRLSIRTHVVVLLLLLLGIVALVPGIVAIRSTQNLVDNATTTAFDAAAGLTIRELHRLKENARAGAEALAANPLTNTTDHQERAKHLAVLATVLRAGPGLSAAYIGWPDGDFVLMRPVGRNASRLDTPEGAVWLAQWTDAVGTRFDFLDPTLGIVESRLREDFAFDPRERPWFSEAVSSDQTIETAPYVFFTTREPGISAARSTASGAVAGVDVSLWDLSSRLPEDMPTASSEAAIVDANGGVLAYTDVRRLWGMMGNGTPITDTTALPSADGLGSPVVAALATGRETADGSFSGQVTAAGRDWMAAVTPLDKRGTRLLMAAPTDELGLTAKSIRTDFLLVFGLLILLALPFIWLASRCVARPVAKFAHDVEQAAKLDFALQPETRTRIHELQALDQAIGAMRRCLGGFTAIFGSIAKEDEPSKTLSGTLDALMDVADAGAAAGWLADPADGSLQPAVLRGKWADPSEAAGPALARLGGRIANTKGVNTFGIAADDPDLGPLLAEDGKPVQVIGVRLRLSGSRLVGAIALAVPAGRDAAIRPNVQSLCHFIRHPLAMAIDRQRLLDELATSRNESELILKSVADGIHVLDMDGLIHRTNPSAAAMLGWSPEELFRQNGHALVHHHRADGSEYPVEDCPIYKTLRDGQPRRATSELFFRKDGSHFVTDFESTPMLDENGVLVGTVISFRDVTERDRWQRELKERLKELHCLYDVVQLTSNTNRSAADCCREIAEGLTGSLQHEEVAVARIVMDGNEYTSANWQPPHASLRATIGENADDFIEIGYSEARGIAGETPFLVEEREMLEAVAAHIWSMQMNRQLNAKLTQLERLNAVGQLTGGVAHDFNNLLTVVLGNAEVLSEYLEGDAKLYPMAEAITLAACKGADLTKQLLAFSRQQPLSAAPTDIGRLLNEIPPLLQRTLPEQIEITFSVPEETGKAIIDSTQLESAILNLCLNARDAMPDGGSLIVETMPATIDEKVHSFPDEIAPGDYICVAVSDTGAGMDRATRNRVFEPFFTTKEVGKGSGLGLSMVYGFVRQSKGYISVYSEPGHGTTIKLYLPRAPEEEEEPRTEADARPSPNGSGTILLVEDDEMVRSNIARQLHTLGYKTVLAETGPDALTMVEGGLQFNLLMTDLILPGGMTGQELARQIRERQPNLPVVITSGYSERVLPTKDRALQGIHILSKPYRQNQLADLLHETLAAPRG